MQKLIAMIPARLGSKRVPKKNIRLLYEKPLLQYAIETAQAAACFKEIWVNTESDLLGELAIRCGANFHKRPVELAADTATNQEFTAEFLAVRECDFVVMVNPTSPLLKPETVRSFCSFIQKENYDTVLSVLNEKAECFFDSVPINFSREKKMNSQDLEPVQKVVWALTAWRRDHFLAVSKQGKCSVFSGRLGRFPIPLIESCDIDTQDDWDLAEVMLLFEKKEMLETIHAPTYPRYWGPNEKNE